MASFSSEDSSNITTITSSSKHTKAQSSTTTTSNHAPTTSKAKLVPPVLSSADDDTLELKDMLPSEPPLPQAGDIMRLAQTGDDFGIRRLLDSGIVSATYSDSEGITPLHWAAINNRYNVCKILIEAGADVNAKGGESVATPAMWAAQEKHYYIVHLLLSNGADTNLTDGQGIKVDIPDAQGHTPLMWAAYKGFPHCVDLYLRWGADVTAVDEKSLTALHWALVKGNFSCIQKLIEYGSDRFAKTDAGKTPLQAAQEMDTLHTYQDALAECDYTPEGRPKHKNMPFFLSVPETRDLVMKRFFFFLPFVMEYIVIWLVAYLPIFLSVPVVAAFGAGYQWFTMSALEYAHPSEKSLHKTPYLSGIFAGTCFWVALRYVFVIFPSTFASHMLLNLFFVVLFSSCVYFYAFAMVADPGFIPKLESREDQKEVVHDLLSSWRFDDTNFCNLCMVRRPLRSKHCRRCGRCVAKHDHHCPWIFNCVGVNNHQQFFLYIVTLEIGLFAYIALIVYRNTNINIPTTIDISSFPTPDPPECSILSNNLCKPILVDPYTTVLSIWAGLQTTWVSMLLVVQATQVLRAQTTYENMHRVNHGYDDHKVSTTVASIIAGGSTSLDGLQLNAAGHGPNPATDGPHHGHHHGGGGGGGHSHGHGHGGHGHKHGDGFFRKILKLLGVDTFMATARDGRRARRGAGNTNPFSRGVMGNCADFWSFKSGNVFKGANSGEAVLGGQPVNYYTLYETPRMMRNMSDGGATRRGGSGQGGAYQQVHADDHDDVV